MDIANETAHRERPADIPESVAAGGVVVRQDAGRLLVALVCEPPQDRYILPKGSQEEGESLEETARREIQEEAGIHTLTLLSDLGVHERLNYRRTAWKVIHYFLFLTDQVETSPTDRNHVYRCEWFPIDDLPAMFWEEQRELIESQLENIRQKVTQHTRQAGAVTAWQKPENVILDGLYDAVLVVDGNKHIRYANAAARTMFNQALNDDILLSFPEEIKTGCRRDIHLVLPHGGSIDVEACSTKIIWEGAPASVVSLRDFTARKRAEEEKHARLMKEVQDDLYREQRLTEVTRTISSALELSVILKSIITLTVDLVGADEGALGLIIPGTRRLTSPYIFSNIEHVSELRSLPGGEALAWHMLENQHPLLLITKEIGEYSTDAFCGVPLSPLDELALDLAKKGITCVIGAPIAVGDHQMGALLFYSMSKEKRFTERLLALVDTVGRQAGVAIQNARLYEEIQEMAITDPLTSLFNRRHFFELARREMERALRYDRPLSVIMCDIDHFKKINDTYGHAAGDVVLQTITRLFIDGFRQSDILCRYGGEEFLIMMPETEIEEAYAVAERIRLEIATAEISTEEKTIRVTLSFGVAQLSGAHTFTGKMKAAFPDGEDAANTDDLLDGLIQRADKALYVAKESGRNRIVAAPEE